MAAALAVALTGVASAQTETIVLSFTGSNGASPIGGLVFDSKGNLYGVTESGGANSVGAIYELTPSTGGGWTESIIYSFNYEGSGGYIPCGGLVFDQQGNLYGEALVGGSGGGLIYQLSPGTNGVWTENVLYNFTGGTDGSAPFATTLALDGSGNLYGTTEGGGTYGFGTVFELVKGTSGTWTKRTLHNFAQFSDGGVPYAESLILDSAGNIYGTTLDGGAYDYGVVFELVRGSNGSWTEKVLHSFSGGADGTGPEGGLAFDAAGNLYGASVFTVFQLVPTSTGEWTENILHTFTGGNDGSGPDSVLTFDKAGNLYGTTNAGGMHRGTVFELSHHANGTWSEKILHKFSATGGDGFSPFFGGVAIDSQGNLYGTTGGGGSSNEGVVYEIVP